MRSLTVLPALCLTLAACDGAAPQGTAEDRPARPAAADAGAKASTAVPTDPISSEQPGDGRAAAPPVVLDAAGLTIVGAGGKRTVFRFGTARAVIDRAVSQALNAEVRQQELADCGAGAMQFSVIGPLTLNYQDDVLVGWTADRGTGLVTSDGIRPGLALTDLSRETPGRTARYDAGGRVQLCRARWHHHARLCRGPGRCRHDRQPVRRDHLLFPLIVTRCVLYATASSSPCAAWILR